MRESRVSRGGYRWFSIRTQARERRATRTRLTSISAFGIVNAREKVMMIWRTEQHSHAENHDHRMCVGAVPPRTGGSSRRSIQAPM